MKTLIVYKCQYTFQGLVSILNLDGCYYDVIHYSRIKLDRKIDFSKYDKLIIEGCENQMLHLLNEGSYKFNGILYYFLPQDKICSFLHHTYGKKNVIISKKSTLNEIKKTFNAKGKVFYTSNKKLRTICDGFTKLSKRQSEILLLFINGLNATQIAEHLCVSIKTVSGHKRVLMNSLGLSNNVEFNLLLAKYAYE
ncbi:LuxR C-terminal-related transcriptional regulator [Yersinia proxima]|uniref:LuxR C-terminal-related transcriptional regulator n=3 Tax=Yersinia proxima TaxID=2890316 RepID=A0ABW9F161_9GAMM|nr:LuxR C-terminal-related transcriptional regulator [Yersinia proxima]CNK92323.1 response regulator protein [Yersinia intermedia]